MGKGWKAFMLCVVMIIGACVGTAAKVYATEACRKGAVADGVLMVEKHCGGSKCLNK